MEPVYMNMQSYPHQNGQMHHYMPRCYHGTEARPPMSHEFWPWGSNYGYAPVGAYHGCCNHAYMPPHCGWGSPYSRVPPYPGTYPYLPLQYVHPPSYNVMEHPRYEYEKNAPMQHHCCACHNHPLHPLQQKEQRNVTIEEEEPERERRKNDSLIPSPFKNSPYPIVWLPPDKEAGKVRNTEGVKDASRDAKEHENGKTVKQQPTVWNGWFPLDLNNAVSSKQSRDRENNSHQDGGKGNFQFPLFWMPYKPDDTGREDQKVEDANANPSFESQEGSGGRQNLNVNKGNAGDRSALRVKDIPVKEVEQLVGEESSIKKEKEGDVSANDRSDDGEKKINNVVETVSCTEGSKRKSPSPPKSSKLPPVCLRVDPLPRKKSANAKSRSPSPPGDKQKLEVKSNEAFNVRSTDNEEQVKEGMNKKTIAVVDGNTSLQKSTDVNVTTPGKLPAKSEDDVLKKLTEEKPEEVVAQKHSESDALNKGQSEDIVSAGVEKEELINTEEMKTDAVKSCSERELSEEEAAVIIQSAYRGFDVRKWELIEKLREIARVRVQTADVKRLVQELELSSDIQGREKQKNIIAETIMSLLLRLDTIQGLHPSIREVRKSEVRELVSLQEQLDTIMNQKPQNSTGQESVISLGQEDVPSKSEDVMSFENSNKINPVDLLNEIDGGSNPERAEFPEVYPIDEGSSVKIGMEAAKCSVNEGAKSAQGPTVTDKDEKSSEVLEYNETSNANEDHELPSLRDDYSTRATDLSPSDDDDALKIELPELREGVQDDLFAPEGTNHSADSSSNQLEEALIGSPVVEESQYEIAKEISDRPHNGVQMETEEIGKGGYWDNCNMDYKSGTEEEIDNKIEDATSEPNECTDQQPEEFNAADKIEPYEASDEGEVPTTRVSTNDEIHENSGATDSAESFPEKESHLLQDSNVGEPDLIKKHTNSFDASADMVGVESAAAAKPNGAICITERSAADMNHSAGVSEMGMLSKEGQEHDTEQPLPKEAVEEEELEDEAEDEEDNAVEMSPVGDDMRESNRKLMEENERLRDMMEKLIKSGHEQLTAISSLSGRVKDLEKRLSRKKKVKVKQQFRAPKSW